MIICLHDKIQQPNSNYNNNNNNNNLLYHLSFEPSDSWYNITHSMHMPLSMENVSVGSPAMFQLRILTASPSVLDSENSDEQGMPIFLHSSSHILHCCCMTEQANEKIIKKCGRTDILRPTSSLPDERQWWRHQGTQQHLMRLVHHQSSGCRPHQGLLPLHSIWAARKKHVCDQKLINSWKDTLPSDHSEYSTQPNQAVLSCA